MGNTSKLLTFGGVIVGLFILYALCAVIFSVDTSSMSAYWNTFTNGEKTIVYLVIFFGLTRL